MMHKKVVKIAALLICNLFAGLIISQELTIDGYVYETGNRGFLSVVKLTAYDSDDKELGSTFSDNTGHFVLDVPARFNYRLVAYKEMFEEVETMLDIKDSGDKDKIFTKVVMKRSPGYMFEITLAEKRDHDSIVVDAIKGSRIEVYNNTKREEVMVLENHPDPDFNVALLKGNHYTILVRKDGYLGKRMEAFVDVEGCILCFEGIGSVNPGVSDNLTEGNEYGVLLANVELDKIYEGKTIPISNINYQFGSAELDKRYEEGLLSLATVMSDNPDLTVEIGSHTDSRGSTERNNELSNERAINVVNFLTEHGVKRSRLIARGYGESKILNDCINGVECSDRDHRVNRRTELKVLGIADIKAPIKSLAQIKQMEQGEALLKEIQFGGEVQVPVDSSEVSTPVIETESEMETDLDETTLEAQTDQAIEDKKEMIKESLGIATDKNEEDAVESESAEELSASYKLVIKESDTELGKGDDIFSRHSYVEMIEHNSKYLYLIGEFSNKVDADDFLKTAKLAYPNSYIVKASKDKIVE